MLLTEEVLPKEEALLTNYTRQDVQDVTLEVQEAGCTQEVQDVTQEVQEVR